MTHVSSLKTSNEVNKLLNVLLVDLVSNLPKDQPSIILPTLITRIELEMLKKRIAIILLLEKHTKVEVICKLVKTTPQTVSRIKKTWKVTPTKSKSVLLANLRSSKAYVNLLSMVEPK